MMLTVRALSLSQQREKEVMRMRSLTIFKDETLCTQLDHTSGRRVKNQPGDVVDGEVFINGEDR
jgi:hypothetical protein